MKPLQAQSFATIGGTPDDFGTSIDAKNKHWTAVITSAGLAKK